MFNSRKKLNKPKLLIAGLVVMLVIIAIPALVMFLGFDQLLLPASVSGKVTDAQGKLIAGATLEVQGKKAVTDAQGKYELTRLRYGIYDSVLSANGYQEFKQKLKLNRFGNSYDFTLAEAEFGEVRYKLEFDKSGFQSGDFQAKLNDKELTYDSAFVLSTGRVLTGTYVLSINSPFYKDINISIDIMPGVKQDKIKLLPAADVFGEIKDWITGTEIIPDRVETKTDNVFTALDPRFISGNKLVMHDLEKNTKLTIKITKQNNLVTEKTVELTQGLNSLGDVFLVPTGRVVGYANNAIFVANYNGSEKLTVVSNVSNCNKTVQNQKSAAIRCNGDYYLIRLTGTPSLVSVKNTSGDFIEYDFWNGRVLKVDNSGDNKLVASSDSDVLLYGGGEKVTSVKAGRNGVVVFSTDQAVYSVRAGETPVKLTDGIFEVTDINKDDSKVLLLNKVSAGQYHIWVVDLQSGTKQKITFLPGSYQALQFINSSEFIYLANKGGSSNLYLQQAKLTTARELLTGVNSAVFLQSSPLVSVSKDGENFLFHLNTGKLSKF